jgi:hypothetical protein
MSFALHNQAVSYVKQFHGIEGPAAKASEHYDAMVTAEQTLKDTVGSSFVCTFDVFFP